MSSERTIKNKNACWYVTPYYVPMHNMYLQLIKVVCFWPFSYICCMAPILLLHPTALFILKILTGSIVVILNLLRCTSQWDWAGLFDNPVDSKKKKKKLDIFGHHAKTLKWECEMISVPNVGIIITPLFMNTHRTAVRNSCCFCIHKHFFRTHNSPWALCRAH